MQAERIYHLHSFFFSLRSWLHGNAWVEKRGSRLRRVLNFSGAWQLDAAFTLWNIMQWNVANRAAVPLFFFFPHLSGAELSAQLCSTSYFIFHFFHRVRDARLAGETSGEPDGWILREPWTRVRHGNAEQHRVFQRWYFYFAARKWPGEGAEHWTFFGIFFRLSFSLSDLVERDK